VKKKQKRVLMIVLGVVAVILCVVQLGPVFMGGSPVKDPSKLKKNKKKKTGRKGKTKAKKAKSGPRKAVGKAAPKRRPAPARAKVGRDAGPEDPSLWPLESITIDLSATSRRDLVYSASALRDPFGPARFETEQRSSSLARMELTLQGVVRSDGQRLAIIENQVYAEGDQVADGVTLLQVGAAWVVLSDGKNEVRLRLTGPSLKVGRP